MLSRTEQLPTAAHSNPPLGYGRQQRLAGAPPGRAPVAGLQGRQGCSQVVVPPPEHLGPGAGAAARRTVWAPVPLCLAGAGEQQADE